MSAARNAAVWNRKIVKDKFENEKWKQKGGNLPSKCLHQAYLGRGKPQGETAPVVHFRRVHCWMLSMRWDWGLLLHEIRLLFKYIITAQVARFRRLHWYIFSTVSWIMIAYSKLSSELTYDDVYIFIHCVYKIIHLCMYKSQLYRDGK